MAPCSQPFYADFKPLYIYNNCQKYVPIESANFSKVIASEAKQSLRASKRLLRRLTPRNDSLSEQIFDNRYNSEGVKMNKSELVKRVAEKLDNLPQKIAAKAVDAVFKSIQEGLEEDGIVKIGQWGTYTVDDLE
jgi:uncharacterized protein (DUF2267 family)